MSSRLFIAARSCKYDLKQPGLENLICSFFLKSGPFPINVNTLAEWRSMSRSQRLTPKLIKNVTQLRWPWQTKTIFQAAFRKVEKNILGDNIKIVLKTGSPVPWLLRGAGLCCHSCHIFLGRPLYTIIMIIVMLRIMFTFTIRLRLYAVVPSPDEQPECLQVAFKGRPQGGGHPVLVPGLTFTLGLGSSYL